jgi:dTDP-4-amino-4,6-dideoxygalactose transaminase
MMDLQAALGLQQLARVGAMHARRAAIAAAYDDAFADLPVGRPAAVAPGEVHAHHLYAIEVDGRRGTLTRDELQAALGDAGIGTSIHFRALHLHRYYADRLGVGAGEFPHAERLSNTLLSLPLSASLDDHEVARVIEAVRRLVA